jgi:hypothetical protein
MVVPGFLPDYQSIGEIKNRRGGRLGITSFLIHSTEFRVTYIGAQLHAVGAQLLVTGTSH